MIEEKPLPVGARIAGRLHAHDRPVGNEWDVLGNEGRQVGQVENVQGRDDRSQLDLGVRASQEEQIVEQSPKSTFLVNNLVMNVFAMAVKRDPPNYGGVAV